MSSKIINHRTKTSYYWKYPERQNWPYLNPLPYYTGKIVQTFLEEGKPSRFDYISAKSNPGVIMDIVDNKALNKVYDQLGQMESLRVAWLERQKAIDLATASIRTLINIARAVKRRDPKIVRAVLQRNPDAKDIIKTPSGLWLSYHFGIVPTVSDLHHAMGIFTSAIPPYKVEASSASSYDFDTRTPVWLTGVTFYPSEGVFGRGVYRVKLGCTVMGINTNVQLATSLGLGQPLSVAWEMMAFSWLVDYVVNVGEFIKNFEPRFPGLTIERRYTSRTISGTGAYGFWRGQKIGWMPTETAKFSQFTRTQGFPAYKLVFKSPADLSGQKLSYVAAVFLPMLVGLKK